MCERNVHVAGTKETQKPPHPSGALEHVLLCRWTLRRMSCRSPTCQPPASHSFTEIVEVMEITPMPCNQHRLAGRQSVHTGRC
jgi:hypothetical protein